MRTATKIHRKNVLYLHHPNYWTSTSWNNWRSSTSLYVSSVRLL